MVHPQGSSGLIPSGISNDCSTFLSKLNANTSITSCTAPLISATAAFAPGSSASQGSVSNALTTLCASATAAACPEPMLRGVLAGFYAACGPELTSSLNADVVRLYDTVFMFTPFYDAVCAKNDAGQFCATQSSGAAGSAAGAQQFLGVSMGGALVPNTTTFATYNIAFLLLQAGTSQDKLCSSCTRNIMSSFIAWETRIAYAPGLGRSQLLGGQSKLYNSIVSVCGTSFLNTAVQAAGSLGSGLVSGKKSAAAALSPAGALASALGAALIGLVTAL